MFAGIDWASQEHAVCVHDGAGRNQASFTITHSAVARGHDHPHAIRILARAWIRVIYRCWLDRAPYEPTKHGAAAHISAAPEHEVAA